MCRKPTQYTVTETLAVLRLCLRSCMPCMDVGGVLAPRQGCCHASKAACMIRCTCKGSAVMQEALFGHHVVVPYGHPDGQVVVQAMWRVS